MNDLLTEDFLVTMNSKANPLQVIGFILDTHESKGFAHFIRFEKKGTTVEFMFGPPEFQIEMLIYTNKGRFAFRDLLMNKDIAAWVTTNRYIPTAERKVRDEILWFVRLLVYSLPYVE